MERRGSTIKLFQTKEVIRLNEYSTTVKGIKYPKTLISLREKLGQKAKCEPKFRFYSLYGHLMRKDVLQVAWKITRKNNGVPGIDKLAFKELESSKGGVEKFLGAIEETLRNKTYRPDAVKRIYIPKANKKKRALGLITIKDRVVQTALFLILEPIFEADFMDCSYGCRPNKDAKEAIKNLKKQINEGNLETYDADLEDCFGSIPHDKLLAAVKQRISDRQVLKLIKMWLTAPIREQGKPMYKPTKGTQQGSTISPLLMNIYLYWFDKAFHSKRSPARSLGATLIRYVDDIRVIAKRITPQLRKYIEGILEKRLGLKINREKTKVVNLNKGETIDFLGYTFRCIQRNRRPWEKYCNYKVSQKALKKARENIRARIRRNKILKPKNLIENLNLYLDGWGQYFCLGYPSRGFEKINAYVKYNVRKHLKRRSQRGYKIGAEENWNQHFHKLGLIKLRKYRYA
jgi:RNA-directed DNA polymerase